MHGVPSTSIRVSPSSRSTIAVTEPRRSLSGIPRGVEEREGHADHPLEIVDRDLLVRRVDVRHPVCEVHTLQATLVEDVRVRRAAGERERRLAAAPPQRIRGELDRYIVL